jgi:four helix bundle protein
VYRGVLVWREAHELAPDVYQSTASVPREGLYGLTSQIRNVGACIPANIAERCGRGESADFGRFCQIASGAASDLEYHLPLAHEPRMLKQ